MATMWILGTPNLALNFRDGFMWDSRISFIRSTAFGYRDSRRIGRNANVNEPPIGFHLTDTALRRGFLLNGHASTRTLMNPITSIIHQSVGTVLWSGTFRVLALDGLCWGLHDGSGNNYFRLGQDNTTAAKLNFTARIGGINVINRNAFDIVANQRYRFALSWNRAPAAAADQMMILAMNGVAHAAEVPTATMSGWSMTGLSIGAQNTGVAGVPMDGIIEDFYYWPVFVELRELYQLSRMVPD